MKLRLSRPLILVTILTAGIAGGLLYWSWVSQTSAWESRVLVQFGSTLVLFVPLVILDCGIETGIDQISTRQKETASDVTRLAGEVAQTQADLRLTREQLSEVVRERIAAGKGS